MGKKHKKQRRKDAADYGYAMPQNGMWQGGPENAGFLQGMTGFLGARKNEQFLLGALLGAGAAWVLSDEEMRGKIMKAGMKLYASMIGGVEEMKEQMADIRAEMEAEQYGGE